MPWAISARGIPSGIARVEPAAPLRRSSTAPCASGNRPGRSAPPLHSLRGCARGSSRRYNRPGVAGDRALSIFRKSSNWPRIATMRLAGVTAVTPRPGQAEARHVKRTMEVGRHRLHPVVPGVQRGDHAVDHHQYRLVAAAFVAVVQRETVQLDEARAAGRCGVALAQRLQRGEPEAQAGESDRQRRLQQIGVADMDARLPSCCYDRASEHGHGGLRAQPRFCRRERRLPGYYPCSLVRAWVLGRAYPPAGRRAPA